jgi:hypothetical protein
MLSSLKVLGSEPEKSDCEEIWKDKAVLDYRRLESGFYPADDFLATAPGWVKERLDKVLDEGAIMNAYYECSNCTSTAAAPTEEGEEEGPLPSSTQVAPPPPKPGTLPINAVLQPPSAATSPSATLDTVTVVGAVPAPQPVADVAEAPVLPDPSDATSVVQSSAVTTTAAGMAVMLCTAVVMLGGWWAKKQEKKNTAGNKNLQTLNQPHNSFIFAIDNSWNSK